MTTDTPDIAGLLRELLAGQQRQTRELTRLRWSLVNELRDVRLAVDKLRADLRDDTADDWWRGNDDD